MDGDKLKTIVEGVVEKAVKTLQEDLNGVREDLAEVKSTIETCVLHIGRLQKRVAT